MEWRKATEVSGEIENRDTTRTMIVLVWVTSEDRNYINNMNVGYLTPRTVN